MTAAARGSANVFLDASYQVDLFGRIRRSNEAALQELLATEEAYRNVTITLVAEVASGYLLLRDLDNRLIISQRTAESRAQSLDIVRTRFEAGMVSEGGRQSGGDSAVPRPRASIYAFDRLPRTDGERHQPAHRCYPAGHRARRLSAGPLPPSRRSDRLALRGCWSEGQTFSRPSVGSMLRPRASVPPRRSNFRSSI